MCRFIISKADRGTTCAITDTKLCIPIVLLSTQDNAKLLEQLKPGFKWTINWNKYKSKVSAQAKNQYLDYLIGPRVQGVNRVFLFLFENKADRRECTGYYLLTVELKDYNVMIRGRNFLINLLEMI